MTKKRKNLLKYILYFLLVVLVVFFSVVLISNRFYFVSSEDIKELTVEDAMLIAQERITEDNNYIEMGGYDLTLISEPIDCGAGCFEFGYIYKVSQPKIKDLDMIEVKVTVEDGCVYDMEYSEVVMASKRIIVDDYSSCVDAGYEVVYPDCIGCSPYCVGPDDTHYMMD